ncbi:MAG TPA: hypothetical protein VIO61_01945 [Anaerolineaceae bacterium]
MNSVGLRLDEQGYFSLEGKRFFPVGVNYWPASCGVEMWARWPAGEIQHDLDILARLGLNCVRFFLRWQDFEPVASIYREIMFTRLAQFLQWCRERNLFAQPSLFVGWMSGGIFFPNFHEKANLFTDAFLTVRASAFARRAAQVIAPYHETLLGIDQGNELCCLPESSAAAPADVIRWCKLINESIREVYPDALIVSGNEQNQVNNDTGWRLGQMPGTDYYAMHGYPVPAWHSLPFDGMTDPLAQSLLPAYVQIARQFGPVLVQEFGTIATFGAAQQEAYLRGMLPACWEAGANGFLWWCLKDITAGVYPYTTNHFESTLGLLDEREQVKPGLGYFLEFCRSLPEREIPDLCASHTAIYLPKEYYPRDNIASTGQHPRQFSRGLVIARHLLAQLGIAARYVRGDIAIDPCLETIIVPGIFLRPDEAARLLEWIRAGGKLILTGPEWRNWGSIYLQLLGSAPVDYRPAHVSQVDLFGQIWEFLDFPQGVQVEVTPVTAEVLAWDGRGMPMVLCNKVDKGCVVYALPMVEETIARRSDDREYRDRWARFYAGMLAYPG